MITLQIIFTHSKMFKKTFFHLNKFKDSSNSLLSKSHRIDLKGTGLKNKRNKYDNCIVNVALFNIIYSKPSVVCKYSIMYPT